MPVSSRPTTSWLLPSLLTTADVEQWLASVPTGQETVTLRLTGRGCRGTQGAVSSLQSALAILIRRGTTPVLEVPDLTFADDRGAELFEDEMPLRPRQPTPHTPAEDTFAYYLTGLILATLCQMPDRPDLAALIRMRQLRAIERSGGLFGHGRGRAAVVVGRTDDRTKLRHTSVTRQRSIESMLARLMGNPRFHPAAGDHHMNELTEFVYQATENTFDHGRRTLSGDLIDQIRMVSVERHNVGTGPAGIPVERFAPNPASAVRRYISALQTRLGQRGVDTSLMRLFSVTVADAGIGIAASMARSVDVYDYALDVEAKLVADAMHPLGTSKGVGVLGVGLGLPSMLAACYAVDGLFQVRSGRLNLHRTYLPEDGTNDPNEFSANDAQTYELRGANDATVLTAGTVVSLLFPVFDLRPTRRRRVPPR